LGFPRFPGKNRYIARQQGDLGVADYGGSHIIGRIIVLLILILVLAGGGILWFDYLNVIDAKTALGPVFNLLERVPLVNRILPQGEGRTQSQTSDDEILNIDAERLALRLEALELRDLEQERREQDIQNRQGEIEQMAQELEERQKALDERENSFNARVSDAEIKDSNVETNARRLTGMPPERAVGILVAMDDQDIIDVFRKTDQIAEAEGTSSVVSYWLSLMPAERAAELNRKMTGRPPSLN
jgi:flagellar protein FlbB